MLCVSGTEASRGEGGPGVGSDAPPHTHKLVD